MEWSLGVLKSELILPEYRPDAYGVRQGLERYSHTAGEVTRSIVAHTIDVQLHSFAAS